MPENSTCEKSNSGSPPLNSLTDHQEGLLAEFTSGWENPLRTQELDRAKVEAALDRLYASTKVPRPSILWCESIWQMVAMESMLTLQALSDNPNLLKDLAKQMQQPLWKRMFEKLLAQNDNLNLAPIDATAEVADDKIFGEDLSINFKLKYSTANEAINARLQDQLSLGLKLKLRGAFRRVGDAEARNLFNRTTLVRAQFGFVTVVTLIGTKLASEFSAQLSDETRGSIISILADRLPKPMMFGLVPGSKREYIEELFAMFLNSQLMSPYSMTGLQATAFAVSNLSLEIDQEQAQIVLDWLTLKENSFNVKFSEKICIVCEAPTAVSLNATNQLHCTDGPALEFTDGSKTFAWNGVVVPAETILAPQTVPLEQIDKEQNAEVRRILIQRYGEIKYLQDAGAVQIDADEVGVLYKKALQMDEPMVMVKVVNSTPEPDGTYKHYFLRVPPYITTARGAVAWTFNMKPEEYRPATET